jgi:aldose sugar dehydrogenase
MIAVLALALCGLGGGAAQSQAPTPVSPTAERAAPQLRVRQVVTGLRIPWDVKSIGHGRLLVTERETSRLILVSNGTKHRVAFPGKGTWVSGETGLMSMAIDPRFADNGRFYTCRGALKAGGGHDIRVEAWRLNAAATRARFQKVLIKGLPTSSGRHGGCRLLMLTSGALMVGTGDAAVGSNPQNLRSLGGKTLRLNRMTGAPWPSNPWVHSANHKRRYILTYGHRNVQGLAQRADGTVWSVEHGPDRDDEVNRLRKGGNYGWNPVPGYNESVPMTDFSLPGPQIGARWSAGSPTLATSGAAWVKGAQWGSLRGTLAVAALKASRLTFMRFDATGHLVRVRTPAALTRYGRLRSVVSAANGDLLVTTSNGSNDSVLRISPR